MVCPNCGQSTVAAGQCPSCSAESAQTALAVGVATIDTTGLPAGATFGASTGLARGATVEATVAVTAAPTFGDATIGGSGVSAPLTSAALRVGQDFGPRYHIIKLLGAGGMGAVYQAWDAELEVAVALKVIRTDRRRGTVTPDEEKRFKNELLLARQVTHKNVVRIHDLGDINGIKYITMPYIHGEDLSTALRRDGKFARGLALRIARQIAAGLEAAHDAGVVHRDLKPANVMITVTPDEVRAQIMDFGISVSAGDATSGAIIGTLEYMAPEQSTGSAVDARADIYAFGLIVYELLTGLRQIANASAQARIDAMKLRCQDGMVPLRTIDASIPEPLEALVMRCLAPDPAARFQTTQELCAALAALDDEGELIPIARRLTRRLMVATAALVVTLLTGTWYFSSRPPPPALPPLPVLVANFENRANDPLFEGTLEHALEIGLEGASFITAYPRRDAVRVAGTMKAGTALDESVARLVAVREGIQVVLTGSIELAGSRYTVAIKAEQPNGTVISTATAAASSKEDVLRVVGTLATRIRRALGDTAPPTPGEMDTFTTVSLEAARAYALGQENQSRPADAIKYYTQAVQIDPNLGRAHAGLAVVNFNLKNYEAAAEHYKKALTLVDRMSEREKYRTLGTYYLAFAANYEQGIDTLRQLVDRYPADAAGWNNLATAYAQVGRAADAVPASRRAIEITPRNALRRSNHAMNLMRAGDFTASIAEAERALAISESWSYAYLPMALSRLMRGEVDQAHEIYSRLAQVGPLGASLSAMGRSDAEMYGGRYRNAVNILLDGIAADEKQGSSGERAFKLVALAEAYLALGRKAEAVAAAARAVEANTVDKAILFLAARVFVDAGEEERGEKLAAALEAKLQKQAKSLALLLAGDIALKRGRLAQGVETYRQAKAEYDSWIVHLLLGKAYIDAGLFPEALTELEAAEKRAGEAADMFIASTTTLRYLPPVYYWLGRAQEGLGASEGARNNYQRFIAIRQQADPVDPLLTDARQRVGQ